MPALKTVLGGGETGGRPCAPAPKQEAKLPMNTLSKMGHRPAWAARWPGVEWSELSQKKVGVHVYTSRGAYQMGCMGASTVASISAACLSVAKLMSLEACTRSAITRFINPQSEKAASLC